MAFIEPYRVAKSLLKLVAQVNASAPQRAKGSDGGVASKQHQRVNPSSDHNPQFADNGYGIICAYDITHDPAHGVDCNKIAETLRKSGDKRLKYLIWNERIWNPSISPAWRQGRGHTQHIHVSVASGLRNKHLYDSETPWKLGALDPVDGAKPVADKPILQRGSKGADVTYLQTLLDVAPDGIFGPQTQAAVIEFQREHDLVADGVAGAYTWAAALATTTKLS